MAEEKITAPSAEYVFTELAVLEETLRDATVPEELRQRSLTMLERLNRMAKFGGYSAEFEVVSRYISWIVALPWSATTTDNLDLERAAAQLEKTHYGMQKVKDRILEYLAVLNLTAERDEGVRASVLCLIGLPGIGKTSVAKSVATAMDRQFVRIAMGGMGSASQLRGVVKSVMNAEPGEVIKGLRAVQTRNPVILLDEIDRISEQARADVMGVLLELLDPEQNAAFTDYYIDFPIDLSEVMFICSGNNTGGIANAVLDRLEVIEMPAYTDQEKMVIGKSYLFPQALREAGLNAEQLVIDEDLWAKVIRPLGYDAGIRTLDRTIRGITRKVARKIVEGEGASFTVTEENIKEFLPR